MVISWIACNPYDICIIVIINDDTVWHLYRQTFSPALSNDTRPSSQQIISLCLSIIPIIMIVSGWRIGARFPRHIPPCDSTGGSRSRGMFNRLLSNIPSCDRCRCILLFTYICILFTYSFSDCLSIQCACDIIALLPPPDWYGKGVSTWKCLLRF